MGGSHRQSLPVVEIDFDCRPPYHTKGCRLDRVCGMIAQWVCLAFCIYIDWMVLLPCELGIYFTAQWLDDALKGIKSHANNSLEESNKELMIHIMRRKEVEQYWSLWLLVCSVGSGGEFMTDSTQTQDQM